jgi:hypothetical protein
MIVNKTKFQQSKYGIENISIIVRGTRKLIKWFAPLIKIF